jgi:ribose-phosphate pyrophosphokinase
MVKFFLNSVPEHSSPKNSPDCEVPPPMGDEKASETPCGAAGESTRKELDPKHAASASNIQQEKVPYEAGGGSLANGSASASSSFAKNLLEPPPPLAKNSTFPKLSHAMYSRQRSIPHHYFRRPKPVWVLSHDSQEELAKKVVECCEDWQKMAAETWDSHETRQIEYRPICRWNKFGDGFPNLFIENVKEMAGKDVIFIASFHNVEVIFEQISMLYEIPRYLAHSCTVILPYFPTGTMERIDLEGQVATAKTLSVILSDIPPTARGPTQIMIFDIHALQERFYFSRTVIPRLETAIPLLVREIEVHFAGRHIQIAFPDDGAFKRFGRLFPEDWPTVVCAKQRAGGDKRIVKIKEGHPEGADVVIVDDLVQSGGTLLEAGKVIEAAGASSVSAFVTHAVFPNQSWKKFTSSEHKFANFWITDSIPHAREISKHEPFRLLGLAPIIADSLLGFDLKQWE